VAAVFSKSLLFICTFFGANPAFRYNLLFAIKANKKIFTTIGARAIIIFKNIRYLFDADSSGVDYWNGVYFFKVINQNILIYNLDHRFESPY
jgi:hypothetical protein